MALLCLLAALPRIVVGVGAIPGCDCKSKDACKGLKEIPNQPALCKAYQRRWSQEVPQSPNDLNWIADGVKNSSEGLCDAVQALPAFKNKFGSDKTRCGRFGGRYKEALEPVVFILNGTCADVSSSSCDLPSLWTSSGVESGYGYGQVCGVIATKLSGLAGSPTLWMSSSCSSWFSRSNTTDEVILQFSVGQKLEFCATPPSTIQSAKTVWRSARDGWTGPADKGQRYTCRDVIPASGGSHTVNSSVGSFKGISILLLSIGNEPCKAEPVPCNAPNSTKQGSSGASELGSRSPKWLFCWVVATIWGVASA